MIASKAPTLLVTGANGFVGSSLISAVADQRCLALVRSNSSAAAEDRQTLSITKWDEQVLFDALEGIETVVHSAAVVHRPGAPSSEYAAFNVEGTRALVAACVRRRVRRFIYISSIKVFGESPTGIINEATPPAPEGPYAATKLEAEQVVLEASRQGDLSTVVFRLCPVFGVGDKGNVRTMIRAIARRRFAIPGDGSTRKSLVHISTVSEAILSAVSTNHQGVFVLADNETPTVGVVADTIAAAVGRSKPLRVPVPLMVGAATVVQRVSRFMKRSTTISPELVRKSLIDTVCSPALAEHTFGIRCHRDLQRSIREEVTWLRKQKHLD